MRQTGAVFFFYATSGRRGGGSDARSGCWPEDVAGSAILLSVA